MRIWEPHGQRKLELYVRILFPRCPCSSEKAAGICFACTEVRLWCQEIHSGPEFLFQFIPKVLDDVEVRALCKPVKFLHPEKPLICERGHRDVKTEKGPWGNCYHNGRGTLLSNTLVAGYHRMWPLGLDKRCEVLQPKELKVYSVAGESEDNTKCNQLKKTTVRWWKCQHANICMMSSTLALPHRYFEPSMATLCKASFL